MPKASKAKPALAAKRFKAPLERLRSPAQLDHYPHAV